MPLLDLHETDGAHDDSESTQFLHAFDEYHDALFRHAYYRLSERERAIEITHDTFIKAWSYVRKGVTIASYKSFLYKILNNLIIDEYRKRKSTSLDAYLEEQGIDERHIPELQEGSLEQTERAIDARKILDLLPELPEQYREVIVLRYIDGLGPKEISELVEVTENIVSLRIHRGLKTLRKLIEQREADTKKR